MIANAIERAKSGDLRSAHALLRAIEAQGTQPDGRSLTVTERRLLKLLRASFPDTIQATGEESPAVIGSTRFEREAAPDRAPVKNSGVSVVSCCMNRSENLLKALPTWLSLERINEVVIVDWNSTVPVHDILVEVGITDSRIRVLRIHNEPRWVLSFAFNIGFRYATHDRILKLDADITLKPDFFERNPLPEHSFVAGDWRAAEKGQEHINGFFYIRHGDLLNVRGFNEFITTYGWDDDDLYARLNESGLKRICVDTRSIHHIPHDDQQRLGAFDLEQDNGLAQLQSKPLYRIRSNRYIAFVMPQWNKERLFAPFHVLSSTAGLVELERDKQSMPHFVSDDLRADAEHHAALELVSWRVGPELYHLPRATAAALLTRKCLEQISPFDVEVLQRGLICTDGIRRHSLVLNLSRAGAAQEVTNAAAALRRLFRGRDLAVFARGGSSDVLAAVRAAFPDCVDLRDAAFPTRGLSELKAGDLGRATEVLTGASGIVIHLDRDFAQRLAADGPLGALLGGRQAGVRPARARPRLIVDTQHGLGNRLRALASAGAIAAKADRDLLVLWQPDHHCGCRLADLIDFPGEVLDAADDVIDPRIRRYNYIEIEPGAHKGELIDLDHSDDVLIRSAYVINHPFSNWDDENRFLRNLAPVARVLDLVASVDVADCVAAHVRMEAARGQELKSYDSAENWSAASHEEIQLWRTKSHYSAFLKRIDALLASGAARRVFLAADMPETYAAFASYFGDRLACLRRASYDRSKDNLIYALADAILLSRCEHLLGSTWSSFTELAQRLSTTLKALEMSGTDF
jgi:hypothetical protein